LDHSWTCRCCGRSFTTLPMNYSFSAPRNWLALPEAERKARATLTDDLCTIGDNEYYVRGCLEIPVAESAEPLVWGVWVSVSKESFRFILDRWDAPIPDDEPARFGWLATWVNAYPEPGEISCSVYLRSSNLRPLIVLQPSDDPLAIDQRDGISLDRVKQFAADAGHD
jgi:hypothetical protein